MEFANVTVTWYAMLCSPVYT